MNKIEYARDLLFTARRISVLTGAGISTDSGIPDFRGPNGIWTKNPGAERLSTFQNFLANEDGRDAVWNAYNPEKWKQYEPNDGHYAIKRLQDQDKLLHIATQNIDRLHHKSGVHPDRISELHGNCVEVMCLRCFEVQEPTDTRTCECGGTLKPNVTLFGEDLNAVHFNRAENAAISCDCYLIVGTTLLVWPAADLPFGAQAAKVPIIYVNGSAPPAGSPKMLNVLGSISEILNQIIPEGKTI